MQQTARNPSTLSGMNTGFESARSSVARQTDPAQACLRGLWLGHTPYGFKPAIPSSCISRWKVEDQAKYVGYELNGIAAEKLVQLQAFAADTNAQRIFRAYGRLKFVLTRIVSASDQYQQILRSAKEEVVEAVEQVAGLLTKEHAIKFFRISRSTYQVWLQEVKAKCDTSHLLLCRKRYPFQLLGQEVATIKRLLTDPEMAHWPVRSIAHYARRTGMLFASINTWYRYRHLLSIRRALPLPKPNKYRKGIRATAPDQIWHADITIFRTLDGVRHFIYLVVDNYSKRILSWRVSDHVSATIRMQAIHEAWEHGRTIRPDLVVDLIVDGGPENVNQVIDRFIGREGIGIHRKIAMKEIFFSNSLVEAVNKIVKYRYLFPKEIANGEQLKKHLAACVHDLNSIRPHGSLNGDTPDERYYGIVVADTTKAMQLARETRRTMNQNANCGKCL